MSAQIDTCGREHGRARAGHSRDFEASSNLLLYLLKEYNFDSIEAVKISSNVFASLYLVPVAGAVVSDPYFGCFLVIIVGTAIN